MAPDPKTDAKTDADPQPPADLPAGRLHVRAADILERVADAVLVLDREWRIVYANREACRINRKAPEEFLGRTHWEEWPAAVGTALERQFRRAVAEGVDVHFEHRYAADPYDVWLEIDAYPSEDGLSLFYRDVSARKAAEEALRASERRFRELADAIPHIAWTTGPDGAVDYYNQRWYDYSGLSFEQTRDWGWASVIHPDDLERAGGVWQAAIAAGAVSEVEYRLRRADGAYCLHLGRSVPVREDGRVVRWVGTATDIDDHRQAEEALRRSEERHRLLLDSTGEGVYGIDLSGRFTFVNRAAARALGFTPEQLLGRDGHALVHHTRPDGAPYPEEECPIHRAVRSGESARVEDDVFWRADGTPFPVAYSAAPIWEHGAVRGAVVTFSDISGRRALEAERERLAERERNIAAQLQEALQPALPGAVPGLGLAKHYEAALAEAGVGGDFYDVFAVEKGRTALVVGDLSGKGLAAAAQVATVRNMLRAFLYSRPTVAEAVTELNRVLAENTLLAGFSTLFVGAYDGALGVLHYVNCGQEPALVRRAGTGAVEMLESTGPILGAIEGARYREGRAALAPGDALAIFTDGLTEVGASRTAMLGVEGVATLLAGPLAPGDARGAGRAAEALARRLIAGVDAFARTGARDDMCLLVAVVDGG